MDEIKNYVFDIVTNAWGKRKVYKTIAYSFAVAATAFSSTVLICAVTIPNDSEIETTNDIYEGED
jgi:hypothetical protein